jgi:hypothetical protein
MNARGENFVVEIFRWNSRVLWNTFWEVMD